MKILAVETSCDETGLALVEAKGGLETPRFRVLENVLASQVDIHRPWGGVVPGLAKREHEKNLPLLFKKLISDTKQPLPAGRQVVPDVVAVTVGPGLEPCLWSGINFMKSIHKRYFPKAKLVGVNHLEGHLYSFLLDPKTQQPLPAGRQVKPKTLFPAVALVVSGGHTILVLMESMTKWKKLGETRDDAVGEAFDKVARMLNLPYPGGPEIEKLAKQNTNPVEFPRPMIHSKDYDFSFSGLKTAVLYYLRDQTSEANEAIQANKANVAAGFQEAAFEPLVAKAKRAIEEYGARSLLLSGGVAANSRLRELLQEVATQENVPFLVAPQKYNTDNGVMITVAAYITVEGHKELKISAQANLSL